MQPEVCLLCRPVADVNVIILFVPILLFARFRSKCVLDVVDDMKISSKFISFGIRLKCGRDEWKFSLPNSLQCT